MAAETSRRELNPLVQRVDALMRDREEAQRLAEIEVPVLTEIVDPVAARPVAGVDSAAAEALARELEQTVRTALDAEIARVIGDRLMPALDAALREALEGTRAELAGRVHQVAREAVAEALSRVLGPEIAGTRGADPQDTT